MSEEIEIIDFKPKISLNATNCPFCGEKSVEEDFCFSCVRNIRNAKPENYTFFSDIKDMRRVWSTTQAEVAQNSGLKQSVIPRFESGKHHHSTKTVQKIINALADSDEFTLRVAPKTIPLWAMLHDEGEYLFELMAWKLDYIADRCEESKRVVDWETIVKETRRAAMACRRLADWDDFNPPKIGIFRGKRNWAKYHTFMYESTLEYLFKLLKKTRCWWW